MLKHTSEVLSARSLVEKMFGFIMVIKLRSKFPAGVAPQYGTKHKNKIALLGRICDFSATFWFYSVNSQLYITFSDSLIIDSLSSFVIQSLVRLLLSNLDMVSFIDFSKSNSFLFSHIFSMISCLSNAVTAIMGVLIPFSLINFDTSYIFNRRNIHI